MSAVTLDLDVLDPHWYAVDPWPDYARLRREAPVWWDAKNEVWAVSRHADVLEVSKNPARFCSGQGFRPKQPQLMPMMIGMDDPAHKDRRRLVSAGFTPRQVAALEPHVRALAVELLEPLIEARGGDVTAAVAAPLPMLLIAEMLGVRREDADRLQRWSDEMTHTDVRHPRAEAAEAFVEFQEYLLEVIADRRREPRGDLVSILTHAEIEGQRLDDDEIVNESLLILVGGNETTRNVISGAVEAFADHPDQYERLRAAPALIPSAVEEALRWVTPIVNFRRTVVADTELHGESLRAGDEVVLLYGSANRDEAVFGPTADAFDVGRDPNPHLAFGFGPHFCLGASLARVEIRVLLEELVARVAGIGYEGDARATRVDSAFIRGITSLPVALTV